MEAPKNDVPTLAERGITKKASTLSQIIGGSRGHAKVTGGSTLVPPVNDVQTLVEQGIWNGFESDTEGKGRAILSNFYRYQNATNRK